MRRDPIDTPFVVGPPLNMVVFAQISDLLQNVTCFVRADALSATPELVNSDPYGQGWLFKVKPSNSGDLASLLDAKGYEKVVEEAGH